MSYTTAWVIGSIKNIDLDVTISGSPQNVSGSRYLYYPGGGSLSLLSAMISAMSSAGLAGPAAVLTQDRRVKLSAAGVFTVTWTDSELRDLLGFTGNLAGASTYTATNPSPLLWSPAKPLVPELSPWNTLGNDRPLAYFTMSPSDGSTCVVSHGTRTDQRWSASHVAMDRVHTASELGGEWRTFFLECAAKGYRFHVYPEVTEETGSTTTAAPTGNLGPYVFVPDGRAPIWPFRRSRGFAFADKRADVSFACRDAPEYT